MSQKPKRTRKPKPEPWEAALVRDIEAALLTSIKEDDHV